MSISKSQSQSQSKKSSKQSKQSTGSTSTKAFVQQTVKLLNDAQSQLGTLANTTAVVAKRNVAKFRKGAEGIIPKIGTLIQNAGLDGDGISVTDMLANLDQGQTLVPLLQQLQASASNVEGIVFGAHTASWQTAMHGYAALQRMSLNDPALAESLQPIAEFMAYRHPSTTDGEPTKPAKKASAKLQKAQKQVSKRAERAQTALTFANSLLGSTTTVAPAPVTAPAVVAPATQAAPTPASVPVPAAPVGTASH